MSRLTNLILAVALIASIAWVLGRESAEAQPRGAADLRIAVVDFTTLGKSVDDVSRIEDLMRSLQELGEAKAAYWAMKVENIEKDLDALRTYGQEDSPKWEDTMANYQQYIAELESVRAVTEFERKKTASIYSAKLLEKMLSAIRHLSQNRFDVVFKVLGDAEDNEEEGLMGEAMRFNVNRAREILFYDPRNVTDITLQAAREINVDKGTLSTKLDAEIKRITDEIADWKKRKQDEEND